MLRALYGRFKRLLAWLNGEGDNSVKDAATYRREMESRHGGPGSDMGGGGDMGL